ncbi:type II toxin-antitoxin system Y4mF family antitoxin [Ottowia testudinis]|uniref:Type II toxin-antitoxin system Y4mF family antitoxin n=1 Tax=Ottowia testudinis TaxID=2816950 RepID=A0A975CJ74_9BURK|nr:type II toxin-antitoxin system Y4mF family antitoxin [Ottowia testudinis]QTD46569.1 type II toxin-antitoxin system Y4mF family antitoxin [Ottowia testudinis]
MPQSSIAENLPAAIRTTDDIGRLVQAQRRALGLRQLDLAGIGNTGNRLIVDIEKGKPTVQLQKVLDVLDLLGLELVVRQKHAGPP